MADNQEKTTTVDDLKREIEMLSKQNTSMFESLEEKINEYKHEFAYLYQQNLSVYNMTTAYVQSAFDQLQAEVSEKIDGALADKLALKPDDGDDDPVIEKVGFEDSFDYDVLASKIAENIPLVDYDYLACKIAKNMTGIDFDNLATAVAEKVSAEIDPDLSVEAVAEGVIARLQEAPLEVDVEALAGSIAEKMQTPSLELDIDELAEAVASKIEVRPAETDYDAIAEKIADGMVTAWEREGAELVADKVAEKLQGAQPSSEVEEVAARVVSRIGVLQAVADCDEIAQKVVEVLPQTDYEEIANRVAEKLNGSDEDVEAYLSEHGIEADELDSSDRVISAVEENSGKTNALVEEVIALLKGKQFVTVDGIETEDVEEEPVQELVDEPAEEVEDELGDELAEEPVQELVDEPAEEPEEREEIVEAVAEPSEDEVAREVVIAEAVAETAAMLETAQESGKTVRLKRSYECKLRQSSDDVKYYYSEIKNELLAYNKVKSGMSWNGDRYNFGRDTIAKININGKTLCLYLALNPDEYSITKYHHKYVGDVKAYESTPMLVKVKSNMGLKKAVALIYEMMEGLKAQRVHKTGVDYTAEYAYKSDEEMIADGLIKASITEKKDLGSF